MSETQKKIEVGDIVILKSGGPKMTVSETRDILAVVKWFHDGKLCTEGIQI